MSGDATGVGTLLAALDVPRLAAWGFGIGVVLTLGLFGFFVVLPGATTRSPLLYLALGFVLALSLGLLVTLILVAGSTYRLIQRTDLGGPTTRDGSEDD